MQDFIERLKAKPVHVRHRIMFLTAGGVSALIAIVWFGALASTGAFTLTPTTVASDGTPAAQIGQTMTQAASGLSAFTSASGAGTNQSTIQVVNTDGTQTAAPAADQTVLPF